MQRLRSAPFILLTLFLIAGVISPYLSVALLLISLIPSVSYLRPYALISIVGILSVALDTKESPLLADRVKGRLTVVETFSSRYYGCKVDTSGYTALELPEAMELSKGDIVSGYFDFANIDMEGISTNSYLHSLKVEGYQSVALPYDGFTIEHSRGSMSWWDRARESAIARLNGLDIPKDQRDIVIALITGHRDMDKSSSNLYKYSGIMHLLAISGLHVAIIASLLYLILFMMRSRRARIARVAIVSMLLVLYILFTGSHYSVIRAVVMFSMVTSASFMAKKSVAMTSYNALFAAAFFIVLITPSALWDVGFRLSFVAVLSILYFLPHIRAMIDSKNTFIRYLLSALSLFIAAQIMLLPLLAYHFSYVSLVAIINNLVATPMVPAIIVLGLCSLVMPLAIFTTPISWMLTTIEAAARLTMKLPFAYIYIPEFGVTLLVISYCLILLLVLYIERSKARWPQRFLRKSPRH